MSMFHVGQMVVCVLGPLRGYSLMPNPAIVGQVYTVRGVLPPDCRGNHGLLLEELVNPPALNGIEMAHSAVRFRPVKETSIEVFRSLLSPIPEEVA